MQKIKNWFKKHLDALALGAIMAIVPLVGDLVWWYRDFLLGEWTWHLAFILVMFIISLTGSIIAMIWYHKTKNDQYNELLNKISILETQIRINKLEQQYYRLRSQ